MVFRLMLLAHVNHDSFLKHANWNGQCESVERAVQCLSGEKTDNDQVAE